MSPEKVPGLQIPADAAFVPTAQSDLVQKQDGPLQRGQVPDAQQPRRPDAGDSEAVSI